MKLYTKEDFLKAAEFCEVSMIDAKYIIERIDEVTDPIELPSDEDEEKAAFILTKNLQQHMGFNIGAKWIRDLIKGGNK